MPDRAQRGAADLAHALGEFIGGREDVICLLIEQEVIIAEVPAAHMPMEVLGFHIERETVGKQAIQRFRDFLDRVFGQIGRGIEIGSNFPAAGCTGFAHGIRPVEG